jgi:hypothetical protein
MKPSDYLKAAAGLVVVGVVVALIAWGVVDA